MKKTILSFITSIMMVIIISGCSTIEEFSNSFNYVDKATNYINQMNEFANDVPPLLETAATDENARNELQTQLEQMLEEIEMFNQLTPPDFAQNVHEQVLSHNQQLEEGINLYLDNIAEGQIDPAVLQEASMMIQEVQELTNMLEQIQNLGDSQ